MRSHHPFDALRGLSAHLTGSVFVRCTVRSLNRMPPYRSYSARLRLVPNPYSPNSKLFRFGSIPNRIRLTEGQENLNEMPDAKPLTNLSQRGPGVSPSYCFVGKTRDLTAAPKRRTTSRRNGRELSA